MLIEPSAITAFVIEWYALGKIIDIRNLPGIVTNVRLPHSPNASLSMLVTESGIVTDVRRRQP